MRPPSRGIWLETMWDSWDSFHPGPHGPHYSLTLSMTLEQGGQHRTLPIRALQDPAGPSSEVSSNKSLLQTNISLSGIRDISS